MEIKELIEFCNTMKEQWGAGSKFDEIVENLKELEFRRKADLAVDTEEVEYNGRVLKAGQRYRHFKKGNIYTIVVPRVFETEDLKEYVIYRGEDNKRRMWARPIEEFLSETDLKKYPQAHQKYRFELIEEGEDYGC